MITEVVLIFDHARQTLTICSNVKVSENLKTAYQNGVTKIEETLEVIRKTSINKTCIIEFF